MGRSHDASPNETRPWRPTWTTRAKISTIVSPVMLAELARPAGSATRATTSQAGFTTASTSRGRSSRNPTVVASRRPEPYRAPAANVNTTIASTNHELTRKYLRPIRTTWRRDSEMVPSIERYPFVGGSIDRVIIIYQSASVYSGEASCSDPRTEERDLVGELVLPSLQVRVGGTRDALPDLWRERQTHHVEHLSESSRRVAHEVFISEEGPVRVGIPHLHRHEREETPEEGRLVQHVVGILHRLDVSFERRQMIPHQGGLLQEMGEGVPVAQPAEAGSECSRMSDQQDHPHVECRREPLGREQGDRILHERPRSPKVAIQEVATILGQARKMSRFVGSTELRQGAVRSEGSSPGTAGRRERSDPSHRRTSTERAWHRPRDDGAARMARGCTPIAPMSRSSGRPKWSRSDEIR